MVFEPDHIESGAYEKNEVYPPVRRAKSVTFSKATVKPGMDAFVHRQDASEDPSVIDLEKEVVSAQDPKPSVSSSSQRAAASELPVLKRQKSVAATAAAAKKKKDSSTPTTKKSAKKSSTAKAKKTVS